MLALLASQSPKRGFRMPDNVAAGGVYDARTLRLSKVAKKAAIWNPIFRQIVIWGKLFRQNGFAVQLSYIFRTGLFDT